MRRLDDWLAPIAPTPDHPAYPSHRLTAAWLDALPLPDVETRDPAWPPILGRIERGPAERLAPAFVAALSGPQDRLEALLGDPVWVAHPAGRLGPVSRAQLLDARPRDLALDPAAVTDVHAYDLPTLRRILPGGLADALAGRMPLGEGRLVCGSLAVAHGPPAGRFALFMRYDAAGGAVHSLPLADIDGAWRASARAPTDEREEVRVAHRVIACLALAQRGAFVALRNLMTDLIEGPAGPMTPEQMRPGAHEPRFDRVGCVVGAPRVDEPPLQVARLEAAVRKRWRGGRLVPRWIRVPVGRWVGGRVEPAETWWGLVLSMEESSPLVRSVSRLAGLWAPPSHPLHGSG